MRARNIKPGFFKSEQLAECEPMARLLFAGLWCLADREGRLEDRPRRIRACIFPFEDCNIDDLLSQLQRQGLIARYVVGDTKVISIPTFKDHQNPHHKETGSILPAQGAVEQDRRRQKRYIYFIQSASSGPIKIGSSVNPIHRLDGLQTGSEKKFNLLGVILEGEFTERGIHEKFSEIRIGGEWFSPSNELLEFIKSQTVPWEGGYKKSSKGRKARASTRPIECQHVPDTVPTVLNPSSLNPSSLNPESPFPLPPSAPSGAGECSESSVSPMSEPPSRFELTPSGLGVAWVFYLKRLRNRCKADDPADASAIFDSMIRQGVAPEKILGEIESKVRDPTEHLWQFKSRLLGIGVAPGANGRNHNRTNAEKLAKIRRGIQQAEGKPP